MLETIYQRLSTRKCKLHERNHCLIILFQAQMTVAEKYQNSKLLRKYFYILRANVTDEHREQVLEKRADDHYR